MTEPSAVPPSPSGPTINLRGGAVQLGMTAKYLPGISKHIELSDSSGAVTISIPLISNEWINPNDVIFVTLGFVRAELVGGAQPSAVRQPSGLIMPN